MVGKEGGVMEGWRSDGGREGGMGVIEEWREIE